MQHFRCRCLYKLYKEFGHVWVPGVLQVGLSDDEKAAVDAMSLEELKLYNPKMQVSRASATPLVSELPGQQEEGAHKFLCRKTSFASGCLVSWSAMMHSQS